MWFSVGAHPAFRCPLHDEEKYEDYYLEFDQNETDHTWLLNDQGLIEQEGATLLKNSNILPLHRHLFDDDALIFKHLKSSRISLKSNKSPQILTVEYEGWPYMGIWAKPAAPYVCIEPWQGIADHADHDQEISHKEGIMSLESGGNYETSYVIKIED